MLLTERKGKWEYTHILYFPHINARKTSSWLYLASNQFINMSDKKNLIPTCSKDSRDIIVKRENDECYLNQAKHIKSVNIFCKCEKRLSVNSMLQATSLRVALALALRPDGVGSKLNSIAVTWQLKIKNTSLDIVLLSIL